jgi:stearoyl-CoA desaturase (delta-9 desaturase)
MTATTSARGTRQPAFINRGANGIRRAEALHRPRRGEPNPEEKFGTRWTTIVDRKSVV